MYFHIDESGNTGNNLFDPQQPTLSYGLLSSRLNVDALGRSYHGAMLATLKVENLHAAELGVERLETIAPILIELQKKMGFDFDYYFVDKPTYGLVQFFEAVYDAGLNEAVGWLHYWTPMRFLLIKLLGEIMDEDLLRRSWSLSGEKRIAGRIGEIVRLLEDVRERIDSLQVDDRTKQILKDPLSFGIARPTELDFGTTNPKIISPNAVGFQFVVTAMGRRVRAKGAKGAVAVTVDHQQQFNAAQLKTHEAQRMIAEGFRKAPPSQQAFILEHPLYRHLDRDEVRARGIPLQSPRVSRSNQSVGLQIVDIYLWLTNRIMQGAVLPPGLGALANLFLRRANYDGISMDGMWGRWKSFEAELPALEDMTESQVRAATELRDDQQQKIASLEQNGVRFI